jgi:hypothetical protein
MMRDELWRVSKWMVVAICKILTRKDWENVRKSQSQYQFSRPRNEVNTDSYTSTVARCYILWTSTRRSRRSRPLLGHSLRLGSAVSEVSQVFCFLFCIEGWNLKGSESLRRFGQRVECLYCGVKTWVHTPVHWPQVRDWDWFFWRALPITLTGDHKRLVCVTFGQVTFLWRSLVLKPNAYSAWHRSWSEVNLISYTGPFE